MLGDQRRGFAGVITGLSFGAASQSGGVSSLELERRLLEMGFVEGARVEILHEGFIGRDPIAVKLDDMRVALRRREARCVRVREEAAE
jgi:ferrous iron transport protein A